MIRRSKVSGFSYTGGRKCASNLLGGGRCTDVNTSLNRISILYGRRTWMATLYKILNFISYMFWCWSFNKNDHSFPILKYKTIQILRAGVMALKERQLLSVSNCGIRGAGGGRGILRQNRVTSSMDDPQLRIRLTFRNFASYIYIGRA